MAGNNNNDDDNNDDDDDDDDDDNDDDDDDNNNNNDNNNILIPAVESVPSHYITLYVIIIYTLKFILSKYVGRLCRYYFVWFGRFFENQAFHKKTRANLMKTRRYAKKIGDASGLLLVLPYIQVTPACFRGCDF